MHVYVCGPCLSGDHRPAIGAVPVDMLCALCHTNRAAHVVDSASIKLAADQRLIPNMICTYTVGTSLAGIRAGVLEQALHPLAYDKHELIVVRRSALGEVVRLLARLEIQPGDDIVLVESKHQAVAA